MWRLLVQGAVGATQRLDVCALRAPFLVGCNRNLLSISDGESSSHVHTYLPVSFPCEGQQSFLTA